MKIYKFYISMLSKKEMFNKNFKKLFSFQGRATTKEYLSINAISVLVIIILLIRGLTRSTDTEYGNLGFVILVSLVLEVLVIVNMAAKVRKLHDIGKSGKYSLISLTFGFLFTPIGIIIEIGFIIFLSLAEPSKGTNYYGPNPRKIKENKKY